MAPRSRNRRTIRARRSGPNSRARKKSSSCSDDVVDITFDLINLSGDVPVALELYDLAGRKVAVLFNGLASSGGHIVTWPTVVEEPPLPGSYVFRLDVDADDQKTTALGVLSVAY